MTSTTFLHDKHYIHMTSTTFLHDKHYITHDNGYVITTRCTKWQRVRGTWQALHTHDKHYIHMTSTTLHMTSTTYTWQALLQHDKVRKWQLIETRLQLRHQWLELLASSPQPQEQNWMFAATLLHSATNAHFFHWSTNSYSQHKALGSYYSQIQDLVDDLVEA